MQPPPQPQPPPHHWTIRDRTTAFKARRWEVERSLRTRRGGDREHEFFLIRIPDFVHVIAVTPARELVMVRQFRHGLEAPTLELPGGLLDASDACPASAARRELREETGYDAPILRPLPVIHPNPALLTNRAHFFVAENATAQFATELEPTEDVELVLLPVEQAARAAREGSMGLTNATHLAALFMSGVLG
ncbi:MAG: NUDIX hydrolase [Phycisphaerales bacterium]